MTRNIERKMGNKRIKQGRKRRKQEYTKEKKILKSGNILANTKKEIKNTRYKPTRSP